MGIPKFLRPHTLGLHKMLQPLRPVVTPALNAFSEQRLKAAVNVDDMRTCARRRLPRMVFDYLDGAADDELAEQRSRHAYADIEMHYQVLTGHQKPDLSCRLFGKTVHVPFFCCPTAGNRMFHDEGERAVARASNDLGAMYCLSTMSTTSAAAVGEQHEGLKVFQLYTIGDRPFVLETLKKAREAGFGVLALTVDAPVAGNRERDRRNGFSFPPNYSASQVWQAACAPVWTWDFLSNEAYSFKVLAPASSADDMYQQISAQLEQGFTWEDAAWLRTQWDGPMVIKGVVSSNDATKAVEVGFDSVWISNHGGRQLDCAPAPLDVLPSIRRGAPPAPAPPLSFPFPFLHPTSPHFIPPLPAIPPQPTPYHPSSPHPALPPQSCRAQG